MQAYEIMNNHVYKVKVGDTVRSVIEKFIEYGISGLPIVNERNEIVAYISDGDIMRYIGKHKNLVIDAYYFVHVTTSGDEDFDERIRTILNLDVLNIAKTKVSKVAWNTELEDIAAILGNKKIKKLPVERNGVLVGIISRGDVIRHAFHKIL